MPVHGSCQRLVALVAVLFVAACAVQGSESEVSVEHLADKFATAEWAAERHCAEFGRAARHLQTLPATSDASVLFLSTRTSVFQCVER
jgi:hypothetical protein